MGFGCRRRPVTCAANDCGGQYDWVIIRISDGMAHDMRRTAFSIPSAYMPRIAAKKNPQCHLCTAVSLLSKGADRTQWEGWALVMSQCVAFIESHRARFMFLTIRHSCGSPSPPARSSPKNDGAPPLPPLCCEWAAPGLRGRRAASARLAGRKEDHWALLNRAGPGFGPQTRHGRQRTDGQKKEK